MLKNRKFDEKESTSLKKNTLSMKYVPIMQAWHVSIEVKQ